MKKGPFKMKGNPMKRNFGLPTDNIASPMMKEQDSTKKKVNVLDAAKKQKEAAINKLMSKGGTRAQAEAQYKKNIGA